MGRRDLVVHRDPQDKVTRPTTYPRHFVYETRDQSQSGPKTPRSQQYIGDLGCLFSRNFADAGTGGQAFDEALTIPVYS